MDWPFKDKMHIFKDMRKTLDKAEILEKLLDAALVDRKVNENNMKKTVQRHVAGLKVTFGRFSSIVISNKVLLNRYIITSLQRVDYLSQIESSIKDADRLFIRVSVELAKEHYLTFLEEVIKCKDTFKRLLDELESLVELFHKQSKDSLEAHYQPGSNNIDMSVFLHKVAALGGKIDRGMGKGGHFGVVFKLFTNTIGPSRRNVNQISGGTLKAFLSQRSSSISPHLDIAYLECYFFYNNTKFENIFLAKYKRLFEV